MKEALIIIDVQNDYFPGGSCELYRPLEAEKKIKELIGISSFDQFLRTTMLAQGKFDQFLAASGTEDLGIRRWRR